MKNEIKYEWCYETKDENGDIIDSSFADSLCEFAHNAEGDLCLIRSEGNEDQGLLDRVWAYVKDGQLPEKFSNEMDLEVNYKVPERYKAELKKYLTKYPPLPH